VLLNPPIEVVKNANMVETVTLEENATSRDTLHTAISYWKGAGRLLRFILGEKANEKQID
jgi:hypothetical protein